MFGSLNIVYIRDWQTFSVRGHKINIFRLCRYNVRLHYSMKVAPDNMQADSHGCVLVKRNLQTQGAGWVWPAAHGLLSPGLYYIYYLEIYRLVL